MRLTSLQVMMKISKKVAAGKKLVEWNSNNNKEKLAQSDKCQEIERKLTSSQAYGVEAFMAVRVLGFFGYYIYQSRKGDTLKDVTKVIPVRFVKVQAHKHANKFEME